jgi:regulator of sigma E protease
VITILAFLFVLGVLIFVHELGHFLVARLYGVRVVTFSLGFGPKLIKIQRGDTVYCISAVPLGGYVKLAGETVEDERTGAPDEFLSKNKWIRFQVYLAGPVMNLLLAWLLLGGVLLHGADVPLYQSSPATIGTLAADGPAAKAGMQIGDRVVSVNGEATPTWDALDMAVLPKAGQSLELKIDRHGQATTLRVTPAADGKFEIGVLGAGPVLRPEILDVVPRSPAERSGIKVGDVVVAINGEAGLDQPSMIDRIKKNAKTPLRFTLERDGEPTDITVEPNADGMIGVTLNPFEVRRVDPTFLQAFQMSAVQNWKNTQQIVKTLKDLVTRQTPVKQLMGPVAIAQLSGTAAQLGWVSLFSLMAMISLNLGLLNLMPVPVLDGGQIAILAVEGLFRRDLSTKVKERILIAGAALIVMLMVTVIYNDVMRLFR